MNKTKIYLITNCYNDPNKIYIGKTINNRKNDHKRRFGKNIEYGYIDEVHSVDKKDWRPLERFWIEYFKMLGFDLQNKNDGGGGPSFQNDEIKGKISKLRKDKGVKSILQYDLEGNFIKEWNSIKDIIKVYKHAEVGVWKSCNNKNHQCLNYLWRYKEEFYPLKIDPYIKNKRSIESRIKISNSLKGRKKPDGFGDMMREVRIGVPKPKGTGKKISEALKGQKNTWNAKIVLQLDMEGNFIKEWDNMNEAGKLTNTNPSSISKVCRGKLKSTNNFKWSFK